MPSYILMQPDQKFAVFSSTTDDFTYFGMSGEEALSWGIKKWGERIALERFASAVHDEPVGLNGALSVDGLGRWRSALVEIALAYGLTYLHTTLAEIGFANALIPQAALDCISGLAAETMSDNSTRLNQSKPLARESEHSRPPKYLKKTSASYDADHNE